MIIDGLRWYFFFFSPTTMSRRVVVAVFTAAVFDLRSTNKPRGASKEVQGGARSADPAPGTKSVPSDSH